MDSRTLRYAEDIPVGVPLDLGSHLVTAEAIVEFATAWDPQDMHVDADLAARSLHGGLIASGLHTMGIFQRLAVLHAYRDWHVIGGRTLREVQLPAPVRPGATLRGSLTVQTITPVRPDRALATLHGGLSHDGRPVLSLLCDAFVRRRPA